MKKKKNKIAIVHQCLSFVVLIVGVMLIFIHLFRDEFNIVTVLSIAGTTIGSWLALTTMSVIISLLQGIYNHVNTLDDNLIHLINDINKNIQKKDIEKSTKKINENDIDNTLKQAIEIALTEKRVSELQLRQKLSVDSSIALDIIHKMMKLGIISDKVSSGSYKVLISGVEYE